MRRDLHNVMTVMTFEEAVAYMSGLLQFGIRLDRERFVALLERLGDPHQKLRCVHIAGTNGKGSTTTFTASILRAAGYRVGAYFSPYVFDLRERIQLDGKMIGRDDFARWVTTIRPHIEAIAETELGQTTEFELKTAVAFCWFAEQSVDFAVIEVGIGGRLDATNVIPPPLVAVITSIGYDHTALLGNTLTLIAGEKAGILKPGTICVTAVPFGEARTAIDARAHEVGVPVRAVASEGTESAYVTYHRHANGTLRLTLPDGTVWDNVSLGLRGSFQAANAATAVAAAWTVRERANAARIDEAAGRAGLANAFLPGRFQVIGGDGDKTLVLDGAHNEDGATILRDALVQEFGSDTRYTFVVGTSRTHAPAPFLRVLAPLISRLYATAPSFKPNPAREVEQAAQELGLPVAGVWEPTPRAIRTAWDTAGPGEIIVVTGSFYVVGETPPELRDGTRE